MYNDISLCYWFKNRIVFVSSYLLDGKFLWAIISVYFLPYVFRRRFRYLLTTSLSKEVRWSLSWLMWWSKKWLSTLLKMSGPNCSTNADSILRPMFFSIVIPESQLMTHLLKITSVAFTSFITADDGKVKPPLCNDQVNNEYTGNSTVLDACASWGSSSNSCLHFLHLTFGSIFLTRNPDM